MGKHAVHAGGVFVLPRVTGLTATRPFWRGPGQPGGRRPGPPRHGDPDGPGAGLRRCPEVPPGHAPDGRRLRQRCPCFHFFVACLRMFPPLLFPTPAALRRGGVGPGGVVHRVAGGPLCAAVAHRPVPRRRPLDRGGGGPGQGGPGEDGAGGRLPSESSAPSWSV